MAPIPPYEYPIEPEQPKKKPELKQPFQRPPRTFITRTPEQPNAPDNVAVTMSHPETVTLPPVQDVVRQPESLTPEPSKVLTPVKQKAPERINENLTNQPQNVNFSPKPTLNFSGPKLPKKFKFKGHPGRQRTNEQVVELLTFAQTRGAFPNGISSQMQRYYRREYPEYFRKGRKRQTAGKIPVVRSAPINIQARRAGSGS